MAQKRYNNWQDLRLSDANNRKDAGTLPSGLYRGFDYDDLASSGVTLVLKHTDTGYDETLSDGSAHTAVGLVKTKQGVMVTEDEQVSIPVTNNSGSSDPRIDLVVMQHTYVEIPGGVDAGYTVILGTPDPSPVAPALTSPLTSMILGQIYWPGGATVIGAATYTRAIPPAAGGGEEGGADYVLKHGTQSVVGTKKITHQLGDSKAIELVGTTLTATDATNYYILESIDSDYHAVDTFDVPIIDDLTHFTVLTTQKLKLITGVNIRLPYGATKMHLELWDTIEVYNIGGTYLVIKGSEVRRDAINKMFSSIIGNKGVATAGFVTASYRLTINNDGNYAEANVPFASINGVGPGAYIDLISDNSSLWDGSAANTKGGNIVVIKFTDSGVAGGHIQLQTGATPVTGYKPITFPDSVDTFVYVEEDGYIIAVENEADWAVIAVLDSNTTPWSLWNYIQGVEAAMATSFSDVADEIAVLTSDVNLLIAEVTYADGGWQDIVTVGTGWAVETAPFVPSYVKTGIGRVNCKGHIKVTGATSNPVFTFPSGYRPSQAMQFPCVQWDGVSAYVIAYITVATSGAVTYSLTGALPSTVGAYLDLSVISFILL